MIGVSNWVTHRYNTVKAEVPASYNREPDSRRSAGLWPQARG